jgi:hypothetical protein
MIIDEFRDSIAIYAEMLREEGRSPIDMLNIVDKRLADISNHIAVCHRVIAEERGIASAAFLGSTRNRHLAKAEGASHMLEKAIAVQADMFDFRYEVLSRIAESLRSRT